MAAEPGLENTVQHVAVTVALAFVGEVGAERFSHGSNGFGRLSQFGEIIEVARSQCHHHEFHAVTADEVPAVLSIDGIAQPGPAGAVDHDLSEESKVGRRGQGNIVQRQPDGTSRAGGLSPPQRSQHRYYGIQSAADIPGRHHVVDRSVPPGRTRYRRKPGGGVDGVIHRSGTIGATGHLEVDEICTMRAQRRVGKPLSAGDIGDQNPGIDDQPPNELLALLATHINRHRPLALVESSPVDALAGGGKRPPLVVRGTADRVDAGHFGAKLGQRHTGQRDRDKARDLDDPNTGQWQLGW